MVRYRKLSYSTTQSGEWDMECLFGSTFKDPKVRLAKRSELIHRLDSGTLNVSVPGLRDRHRKRSMLPTQTGSVTLNVTACMDLLSGRGEGLY